MRTSACIAGFAIVALLGACSHQNTQTARYGQNEGAQATAASSNRLASNVEACPMAQLRDIQAFVSDMNDGVAITFTAPYAEVDQLRQNVRAMADAQDMMGNAFAACPCGQGLGTGVAEAMPSDMNSGSGAFSSGPGTGAGTGTGTGMAENRTSGTYGANQYTSPTTLGPGPAARAIIAIPPSKATVDEIPSGAVLELRGNDQSQLLILRTAIKAHVHALRSGCLGQPSPR
ncbi:MAG TPA: hypothetical protein VGG39_27840 [Polyangiaceae bacterium]|jgi:hypothetical protein